MYQRKNTPIEIDAPVLPTYQGIPERGPHGQWNDGIGSWDVALSHESQYRSRNQEDRGSNQPRGKGPGHPRPAPNTQHQEGTNSHKARTQTHRPTTKGRRQQKGNHLGNQESFSPVVLPIFPLPVCRCFDRFLGRRPRHGAALGLSYQLRDAVSQTLRAAVSQTN